MIRFFHTIIDKNKEECVETDKDVYKVHHKSWAKKTLKFRVVFF